MAATHTHTPVHPYTHLLVESNIAAKRFLHTSQFVFVFQVPCVGCASVFVGACIGVRLDSTRSQPHTHTHTQKHPHKRCVINNLAIVLGPPAYGRAWPGQEAGCLSLERLTAQLELTPAQMTQPK